MTRSSSVGALAVGALMFGVVLLTGCGNGNSTESSATRFERLLQPVLQRRRRTCRHQVHEGTRQ